MAHRLRLLTQTAFLALSLGVFFDLLRDRHLIALYHGLHVLPTLAPLPWFALPPLGLFSMAVLGALLLASLLLGRLYCGFLCPVGFVQELSARLGRALGLAGRPVKGWTGVRLFVLALVLALLALRSSAFLYFDHFSSLGRVYGAAHALFNEGPFGANFMLGLAFLAVMVLVPLRWPRWFCGALCPSGTLFMLMQALAPGKVRSQECGGDCGLCAAVCPALCISDGRIDGKLCVNCLECSSNCASGAMSFTWRWPWRSAPARPDESGAAGVSRREFLAGAGFSLAGAVSGSFIERRWLRLGAADAVVPPGGKAQAEFLERCVACDTCVSVCPTKVIVPAGRELGLRGLAKVKLDYSVGYCAYECNACLAVCPSGAISYFPLATKKRVRIGKSRLIKDICIPFAFERDCGACQEQCPTGAITMEPYRSVFAPVQHEDFCIGCGACQFACPTRPHKAIVVDPIATHTFAAPPAADRQRVRCRGRDCRGCPGCRPAQPEATVDFPF